MNGWLQLADWQSIPWQPWNWGSNPLWSFFSPIVSVFIHSVTVAELACWSSLISLNNTNRTSVGKDKAHIGWKHAAVLCRYGKLWPPFTSLASTKQWLSLWLASSKPATVHWGLTFWHLSEDSELSAKKLTDDWLCLLQWTICPINAHNAGWLTVLPAGRLWNMQLSINFHEARVHVWVCETVYRP